MIKTKKITHIMTVLTLLMVLMQSLPMIAMGASPVPRRLEYNYNLKCLRWDYSTDKNVTGYVLKIRVGSTTRFPGVQNKTYWQESYRKINGVKNNTYKYTLIRGKKYEFSICCIGNSKGKPVQYSYSSPIRPSAK
jgi:hypothetical protein